MHTLCSFAKFTLKLVLPPGFMHTAVQMQNVWAITISSLSIISCILFVTKTYGFYFPKMHCISVIFTATSVVQTTTGSYWESICSLLVDPSLPLGPSCHILCCHQPPQTFIVHIKAIGVIFQKVMSYKSNHVIHYLKLYSELPFP